MNLNKEVLLVYKYIVRCPVRTADLGWTDTARTLLYLPNRVGFLVNFPIQVFARAEVSPVSGVISSIHSHDLQATTEFETSLLSLEENEGTADKLQLPKAAVKMAMKLCELCGTKFRPFHLDIRSDAPVGSGLGASASVSVAILRALAHYQGVEHNFSLMEIAHWAQKIETELLGHNCGIQDQVAAALAGVYFMKIEPVKAGVNGGVGARTVNVCARAQRIDVPSEFVSQWDKRVVVIYTGKSHFSSAIHEKVYERLANEEEARQALNGISQLAPVMEKAVEDNNFKLFQEVLRKNWSYQLQLSSELTSDGIEKLDSFLESRYGNNYAINISGAAAGGTAMIVLPPREKKTFLLDVPSCEGCQRILRSFLCLNRPAVEREEIPTMI